MSHTVVVMGVALGEWESMLDDLGLHAESDALLDFYLRSRRDQQRRRLFCDIEENAASEALALAFDTQIHSSTDATKEFLRNRSQHLMRQLQQLPSPDAVLLEQCKSFQLAIEMQAGDLSSLIEQYRILTEHISNARKSMPGPSTQRTILSDEIAALRDDVQSSLLRGTERAEIRADILKQIITIEELIPLQPAIAAQGIALLRHRLHREIFSQYQRQQEASKHAENIRTAISIALSQLHVLMHQHLFPEITATAKEYAQRLSYLLSQQGSDVLPTIEGIAQEIDATFTSCTTRIEDCIKAQYLESQVADALLVMGYQVTKIQPQKSSDPHTVVAAVGNEIGLEVRVDSTGELRTEMVALSNVAKNQGVAAEERICAIVDRLLEALRQRSTDMRERYRHTMTSDEVLRVVQLSTTGEQPILQSVQQPLKEMMP